MPALLGQIRKVKASQARSSVGILRVGYVPLTDSAPLLIAESLGIFHDAGLRVRLNRELGWGSIREKVVYGELDAAHAPGALLFSILCGTHSRPKPVRSDLILNLQGNAITLSRRLWEKGVRDAATLKQLMRSEAPKKPTFAVVSPFSSHIYLLRKWLSEAGIDPDRDVRTVFLPPALVGDHMKERLIDGFCVGEPWNSASTSTGEGWIVATSASLSPLHPEKVLLVSDDFHRERTDEYAAFRQAILTACHYCDTPQGRIEIVELLHTRKLFPVSKEVLANSLIGPLKKGVDQPPETSPFVFFSKNEANRATRTRAVWMLDALAQSPSVSLDAAQRRACLQAFHDVPTEIIKQKPTTRKTKRETH